MYHVSGRISLIEGNAESFRLKSNLEKYFAAAVYLSEAPSLITVPFSPDKIGRYILLSLLFLSTVELQFKKDNLYCTVYSIVYIRPEKSAVYKTVVTTRDKNYTESTKTF